MLGSGLTFGHDLGSTSPWPALGYRLPSFSTT